MTPVVGFEWRKWTTRRDARWTLAILGLGSLACGWFLGLLVQLDVISDLVRSITRAGPSGFEIVFATLRTMMTLIALFAVVWGSSSVVGELERGTLRTALLRVPRHQVPAVKALVVLASLMAVSLLVLLLGNLAGAATFGLEGIEAGNITLHSAGALLRAGLLATALSWFPLASWLSLAVCVSCLARGSQSALTITLLLGLLLGGLTLVPGLGRFLFPDTWWWPFDVATSQAEGLRTMSFGSGLGRHVLVNLAWTTGLLALGTRHFAKKDLTS